MGILAWAQMEQDFMKCQILTLTIIFSWASDLFIYFIIWQVDFLVLMMSEPK